MSFWEHNYVDNVAKLEYNTPILVFCHKEVSITFRKLSNSRSIDFPN
jgi:hypothetical protein